MRAPKVSGAIYRMMYERIVALIVSYGAETWGLNVREKNTSDMMK